MNQRDPGQGGEEPSSERTSLETVERLRADIVSGALRAGARLRFGDLQDRYETGTSPLREALSRLTGDRLVVQEVNRGFSVPPLSVADFRDIADLRIDLEAKALRAAVANGDETWEEGIVLAHHRLRRLGAGETAPETSAVPENWERRHRAFHTALIAACGSAWTLTFCGVLHDQFDRYRRWAGRDPATQARLSRHHSQLTEAALGRDAETAAAILVEHVRLTADAVTSRLSAGRDASPPAP